MRPIIAALLLVGCIFEIRSCDGWMVPMASSFLRPHASSVVPISSKSSRSSLNRFCVDRPFFLSSSTSPAPFRRNGGELCLGASEKDEFVEAEDLEALQKLFSNYCDSEGLMTKFSVMQIPAIAELMLEEDLLPDEFSDIWDKAPKFPDVEASDERIDVDSFVQVYRDIDDLFESEVSDEAAASGEETAKVAPLASEVKSENNNALKEDEDDDESETLEAELESIYESICDKNGLISKDALQAWDEVGKLMEDGLLGEDEFEDLWAKTQKSSGNSEELDVDGFLSFNVALDGLFDFDAEEMIEDDDEETLEASSPAVAASREMVEGESLSSRSLFAALADSDGLVSKSDLKRWSELQDMQAEGDLLPLELENLFDGVAKSAKDASKLDESGFVALYQAIADLFEENDEDTDQPKEEEPGLSGNELKQELIDTIKVVASDKDRMACGLECTETEQRQILSIVTELESRPTNIIRQKQGAVYDNDLTGTWDLLYSSSSAMKYNKGLSGLGGSFPNGKFGGLRQKLMTSKFTTDVEYVERIDVTPSAASFDVTVTGGWDLRTSISIFTGEPSLVMTVEPDRVTYGPTSTRADHWKSLGPLNMLDVSYLDDDLRIMRGNTSIETVFIFRRSS